MPTYVPGDHVLTFNWGGYGVGDVIVFRGSSRNYIKRIGKIKNEKYFVSGDNAKQSVLMAPVNKKEILGRVVFKY